MLFLGLDIGSSSIKAALLNGDTGRVVASSQSPDVEMPIIAAEPGWAEQDPELWWSHVKKAISIILSESGVKAADISAIGIAYQMHGLVLTDTNGKVLRPSIIWCDSRAIAIGNKAYRDLGETDCIQTLLNSPGNFTASKLKWVQENEPTIYEKIKHSMLPGDYIAFRFTGNINTTIGGLTEGTFWNFKAKALHKELLDYFGIREELIPPILPNFGNQGTVLPDIATELGLGPGVKVTYRAGDQPNNAFALNVNAPGQVAATAGTSGVVYALTDSLRGDRANKVNTFAHATYKPAKPCLGVLLCINGMGIAYSWLRNNLFPGTGYEQLEKWASEVDFSANGPLFYPFGNGAERMLGNRSIGAHYNKLQFNEHSVKDIIRATLEGMAFAMVYGIKILEDMDISINCIHAGNDNLFQSSIYSGLISNLTGAAIKVKNTSGALGAARGAAIGAGWYQSLEEAFKEEEIALQVYPDSIKNNKYEPVYAAWVEGLHALIEQYERN